MHSRKTENKRSGEIPLDYFSGDSSSYLYRPPQMLTTDGYQQGNFSFNEGPSHLPAAPIVTFVVGENINDPIGLPQEGVYMPYRTVPTTNVLAYRHLESPLSDVSLNTPKLGLTESQLGDIISETLPSAGSAALSSGAKETKAITSAQLMEDWLAASSLKPEDFRDLEQEIGI